tara:strand:- start:5090 stop:6073 length:984 start_codon:yes stop_codon:yes gene_type:complete
MPTLMYRLEQETNKANKSNKNNKLTAVLLESLRLFKGEISQISLMKNISGIMLTEQKSINTQATSMPLSDFLNEKLTKLIQNLPETVEQRPENNTASFKERMDNSTGMNDNFGIAFDFFKDVVWDYSINLFQIIMGSKNPAASLYEYTNETSKQVLSHLKSQEINQDTYGQVKKILQNINNNLWKIQKEQRIQNIDEVINFKLAGLIFASSFMLATLSIIAPVIGMSVGFSSVMSSLYLSAGVAGLSAGAFVLSYLEKADLAIRGSDTYSLIITKFAEESYDNLVSLLSPVINFYNDFMGNDTTVFYEENTDVLNNACEQLIKTHSL